MFLKSVELRDWRSYRHARFEFPKPESGRNVVLIMAPNEHGKTSFFEAVTLGLFGREGLPLIPRARATVGSGDATERLNTTYSQFLSNTLHRRAIEAGRQSCSVVLEMEDEDGDVLEISRKWHFRQDGGHRLYDDQLQIFEGAGRVPVLAPVTSDDKEGWYREFIAQRFIPSSLAEFFLFDGEQVQRYAGRDMAEQVRRGIEGLLGLPVLKSLRESLAGYAQARRSSAASPSDTLVKTVEADIAKLEAELSQHRQRRDAAATLLPQLQAESEQLSQQLGRRGEGTIAMVAELFKDEERYRAEAQRAIEGLKDLLAGDVALALAGADLRKAAVDRLSAEAKRERWEAGRNEGNANLDRYQSDLGERLGSIRPPLGDDQSKGVLEAATAAWEALWHPPPEGCADEYLHTALTGISRAQAIERLEAIGRRSVGELVEKVERFHSAVATAEARKRERLEIEQTAPEAEKLSARLKSVSEEVGKLQGQRDEAERAISGLEGQLASKRQELGRHMDRIGRGAPALRRAQAADQFAKVLGLLLSDAVPAEVGAVAEEMTRAWKSMAHLTERVDRIEITDQCEVRMLNAQGEDLHQIEKSAGASQVFTQALIVAVTNVSKRAFPFVVDTPLARLSRDQRLGVLRTFTDRPGQVILLSTDEEVVGEKLEAIRDRISAAYSLEVAPDNGVAVTSVQPLTI